MKTISFSVVIPLYNKEFSVRSTVESVINQAYKNFELIIVNDGSTDNSLSIVQSINDRRITIISQNNHGVSAARNKGVSVSKNQYIVFLDADDIWSPDCLDEFCHLITHFSDAQVYCTNFNMSGKTLVGSDKRYYVNDYFYVSAFFLAKWSIPIMLTGCVAMERNLFNSVGYFNTTITHGEDIDFWRRLSNNCRIVKSERITTLYRTNAENRASSIEASLKVTLKTSLSEENRAPSKSEKLYNGVQSIMDFKELILSGNFSNFNSPDIKNLYWSIKGLFFILIVRLFDFKYVKRQ